MPKFKAGPYAAHDHFADEEENMRSPDSYRDVESWVGHAEVVKRQLGYIEKELEWQRSESRFHFDRCSLC